MGLVAPGPSDAPVLGPHPVFSRKHVQVDSTKGDSETEVMISDANSQGTARRWPDFLAVGCASSLFGFGMLHFCSAFMTFREASLAQGLGCVALLLLASLVAWVVADFCSGVVHFIADNYGSPKTPILGRTLIAPFRQHHLAPTQMLEHGFLERNANNALATLPLLSWIPLSPLNSPLLLFGAALSLQLSGWIFVTNEIHALCHQRPTNRLLLWLQKKGLLLDPAEHALHHEAASGRPNATPSASLTRFHYCITSGICDRWARSLLARIEKTRQRPRQASR